MTSSVEPIVIIGSGLAGYMLAQELRKLAPELPLTIVTRCDGRYYYKPTLSNALLKEQTATTFALVERDKMAQRLNAIMHVDEDVLRIDPEQRQIHTAKQRLPYSKLILACGAQAIMPELMGDVESIYSVNNLADYEALQRALVGKQRIGILGAGFVGCEFANTLALAGYAVDVIAPASYPLATLLPETLGLALQRGLQSKGVAWHWQQYATAIEKTATGYQLHLNSGAKLTTDLVLSTIGLRPNTTLAHNAGLTTNRGICVNRQLQTSSEHIYALGDCAEMEGQILQFVAPLLHGARALAKTLTGQATPVEYPVMPIILKTPTCPIVAAPPPMASQGQWQISGQDQDLKAIFVDTEQRQRGFALTGAAISEKQALSKAIL